MKYEKKHLKYKDRIVFGKQSMPYFDRMPKQYFEDEACFVFVNEGEVSVRSQDEYINLNNRQAILAKCLNYFFETNSKQRKYGNGIEVIAVILYPTLVEELFEFDLSKSDYSFDFNIKQMEVDGINDNTFVSGVFYASKANKLTGPVIDQSTIFSDLNDNTFQDNANEAIHRFIK